MLIILKHALSGRIGKWSISTTTVVQSAHIGIFPFAMEIEMGDGDRACFWGGTISNCTLVGLHV